MSKDPAQKLFNYIAALENTNEELVKTLKKSVELLTEFKSSVPDPRGWQEMLDLFPKDPKSWGKDSRREDVALIGVI